jgi:surface carbohydrate biosynthesis protein
VLIERDNTPLCSADTVPAVALPIETKVRELYGKLWLSSHLTKKGYDVVIGTSWEVDSTIHSTQPDFYISKDPSDENIEFFDSLREAGVRSYGLPPEGGVGSGLDRWVSNRTEVINHLDGFFCWGKAQQDILSSHYQDTSAILNTGNPRFDLPCSRFRSLYEHFASTVRKEYAPFILINTNFGYANPFDKDLQFNKIKQLFGDVDDSIIREDSRTFYSFLETILYLAEEVDANIIIRPHPGEDQQRYHEIFDYYENIHIIHEGDVRTWISAADVVIHHDCTTGIESALMDSAVISYRPIDSAKSSSEVSQAVSREVFDRNQLLRAVRDSISDTNNEILDQQYDKLLPYFQNIDSCAALAICEVFEDQNPMQQSSYNDFENSLFTSIEMYLKTTRWEVPLSRIYDRIRMLRTGKSRSKAREKNKQKFPGLSENEIRKILNIINRGQGSNIKINSVSLTNNTYLLRSES